jgi:hypothetical protein
LFLLVAPFQPKLFKVAAKVKATDFIQLGFCDVAAQNPLVT